MKKIFRYALSSFLSVTILLSSMIFAKATTANVDNQSAFVSAISSGASVINIMDDFGLTVQVVLKKSVTINATDHTITLTNQGGEYFVLAGAVDVVINGGIWNASGGADVFYGNRINNTSVGDAFSGSLIITGGANITANVPVNFGYGTSGLFVLDDASIAATSGNTIKNQGAVNLRLLSGNITTSSSNTCIYNDQNSSGSIVVGKPDNTGPTIRATNTSNSQPIFDFDSSVESNRYYIHGGTFIHAGSGAVINMKKVAEVNIESGTFKNNSSSNPIFNIASNSIVKIMGGDFTATSSNILNINSGANVFIKGGNFNKGSAAAFNNLGVLKISGGTFNFNPSSNLVFRYTTNQLSGKWTVVENTLPTATTVGSYSQLSTAISNKASHIKLTASFQVTSSVTINFDTVLDGNGYTLTGQQILIDGSNSSNILFKNVRITGSGDMVKVSGNPDLTISGGVFTGTHTQNSNYGPLYINNNFRGIVTVTDDAIIESSNWGIYSWSSTDTVGGGVLNLIDCTIEKTSGNSYKKHLMWFRGPITVNIGGGVSGQEVKMTSSIGQLIYTSENAGANINIKDGAKLTQSGYDWALVLYKGTFLNMTGGTLDGGLGSAVATANSSNIMISGGTITSKTSDPIIKKGSGILLVTGGNLSNTGTGPIFSTDSNSTGYFVLNADDNDNKPFAYATSGGSLLEHKTIAPLCIIGVDANQDSTIIKIASTGGDISLNDCNLESISDVIICSGSADINLNNNTIIRSTEGQAVNGGNICGDGTGKTYNAGEEDVIPDYEDPEKKSIAILLKGGDRHQYSFKVNLEPSSTYKFMYTYRTTGNIPTFRVVGDVDVLSVKDKTTQGDDYTQIYHITTDNFIQNSAEYIFEFEFKENTYDIAFYIANMQLYKMQNNEIHGQNILAPLNPVNNETVASQLNLAGQSMGLELNGTTATNGWFGKFNSSQDAVSDYAKYVKVNDVFFDITSQSAKLTNLRSVVLGVNETDFIPQYDEHCDNVITVQDLLRLKKANISVQTPPTSVGEELSSIKPNALPAIDFGTVSSFVKETKYIKLVESATLSNYNTYIQTLKNNGFVVYSENILDNNRFTTLINEVTTATVYYMPKDGTLRVVAEPKKSLYPREKDNVYTSINKQGLLTAIKGDTTLEGHSMSYVIRLNDGSFIIIDGGTGTGPDPENLLEKLTAQTPKGEKPVISAWIFTHCHEDHIGNFSVFSEKYRDSVIVERIYYNFQAEEDILQGNGAVMLTDPDEVYIPHRYNNFKKVMKTYYSDVPKITPHTGDRYYIKNAMIDILYTHEDELPSIIKTMNNSSTVFKLSVEGQTMLITGDMESTGILDKITYRYSDYVKSDFVQAPHGGKTNSIPFYQATSPTYLMLPINHSGFNSVLDNETYNPANYWVTHVDTKLRHVVTPGNGTVSIPLPFNPSDDEAVRNPSWSTVFKDYSYLY